MRPEAASFQRRPRSRDDLDRGCPRSGSHRSRPASPPGRPRARPASIESDLVRGRPCSRAPRPRPASLRAASLPCSRIPQSKPASPRPHSRRPHSRRPCSRLPRSGGRLARASSEASLRAASPGAAALGATSPCRFVAGRRIRGPGASSREVASSDAAGIEAVPLALSVHENIERGPTRRRARTRPCPTTLIEPRLRRKAFSFCFAAEITCPPRAVTMRGLSIARSYRTLTNSMKTTVSGFMRKSFWRKGGLLTPV